MNTSNVVFALAWPVVFFSSFAEVGAGTAAVAATLIAIVFAGGVAKALGKGRHR